MDVTPDLLRLRWFAVRADAEQRLPALARQVNELFARVDAGRDQPGDLGTLIAMVSTLEQQLARGAPPPAAPPPAGVEVPADALAELRHRWHGLRALAARELPALARDVDRALAALAQGRGAPADLALAELGVDWAQHLDARPETWQAPELPPD